ncbi:MAG: hypothetical protein ACI86S_002297, partial [Paracoccaceae bacterium]
MLFSPPTARYTFGMTTDQIILFALFGSVFGMLLWGK